MRSRRLAAILLALVSPTAACQLIWSYDDFKDQRGTGGSGGATSSSISSSASSTSSTASSSGGGAPSSSSSSGGNCVGGQKGEACTKTCDVMAVAAHESTIQTDVKTCTIQALGNPNPVCIINADGLSYECADCWATLGQCGYLKCTGPCAAGQVDSATCNDCLAKNCDCAFTACSGTIRPAAADAGTDASCD